MLLYRNHRPAAARDSRRRAPPRARSRLPFPVFTKPASYEPKKMRRGLVTPFTARVNYIERAKAHRRPAPAAFCSVQRVSLRNTCYCFKTDDEKGRLASTPCVSSPRPETNLSCPGLCVFFSKDLTFGLQGGKFRGVWRGGFSGVNIVQLLCRWGIDTETTTTRNERHNRDLAFWLPDPTHLYLFFDASIC